MAATSCAFCFNDDELEAHGDPRCRSRVMPSQVRRNDPGICVIESWTSAVAP